MPPYYLDDEKEVNPERIKKPSLCHIKSLSGKGFNATG